MHNKSSACFEQLQVEGRRNNMSLFAVCLCLAAFTASCRGAVTNLPCTSSVSNLRCFTKWPSGIISYKYKPIVANGDEKAIFDRAAEQIRLDTGGCITFKPVADTFIGPHLVIHQRTTNGTTDICTTFPGYTAAQNGRGQIAIMFGSASGSGNIAGGCLDTVRDAMRILMNAIGIRNEYMRDDRDDFLDFTPTVSGDRNSLVAVNLQRLQIFDDRNRYNISTAVYQSSKLDINSITMVSGSKFAGSETPIFTLKNNLVVGQQARLSKPDCDAVRSLYECTAWDATITATTGQKTCTDPYTTSAAVSFDTPTSNVVLSRSLQCAQPGSSGLSGVNIELGHLVLKGITWSATANKPVISVNGGSSLPEMPGLSFEVIALLSPVALTPSTGTAATTPGVFRPVVCPTPLGTSTCVWSVRFKLVTLPVRGFLNEQITLDVQDGTASTTIKTTIPVTLKINCAPQFRSITAHEGYGPTMTTEITKTVTNGIDYVALSGPGKKLDAPPWVYGTSSVVLTPYMVDYNTKDAFGEDGVQVTATAAGVFTGTGPTKKKVFVNCNVATAAVGNVGGVTAVAQVSAVDPEGGPISYFAYSGVPNSATVPELHTVTKDGVVLISVYAPTTGEANTASGTAVFPPAAAATGAGNPGAQAGTFATAALGATRDILIVAVDSHGSYSVLMARFNFACGVGVG